MDRIYGRGAGERGQDGSMTGARTWGKPKMLSTFSAPAGENWEKKTLIEVARRLDVHLRRTISSTKTQKEEVPIPPGCWNSFMRIDTIKISGPVS